MQVVNQLLASWFGTFGCVSVLCALLVWLPARPVRSRCTALLCKPPEESNGGVAPTTMVPSTSASGPDYWLHAGAHHGALPCHR